MTTGAHQRATRSPRPAADGPEPGGGAGSLPRLVIDQLGRRVGDVVGDLVTDLERTVPGAVAAAYVVGSAAQRDHRRDLDDLDLVLVLAGPPDALLGRLLDDVHARVERAHPDVRLDLVYTTWRDLGRHPVAAPTSAGAAAGEGLGLARRDGRTLTGPEHRPGAVVRHQLLDHGLAVIGPSVSVTQVATSRDALSAHCLREIAERWTPWWERSVLLLSAAGRASLAATVTDPVLRIARVHHTLLSGEVRSLTEVGEWALTVCEPEWTRLVQESLRVRQEPHRPSLYRSPLARRRDALDFTDLLMTADEEAFGVSPAAPVRQPPGSLARTRPS